MIRKLPCLHDFVSINNTTNSHFYCFIFKIVHTGLYTKGCQSYRVDCKRLVAAAYKLYTIFHISLNSTLYTFDIISK